jgi:hypothetical protein
MCLVALFHSALFGTAWQYIHQCCTILTAGLNPEPEQYQTHRMHHASHHAQRRLARRSASSASAIAIITSRRLRLMMAGGLTPASGVGTQQALLTLTCCVPCRGELTRLSESLDSEMVAARM